MSRTPDDGSGPLDVDAAFAEIVARWGEDAPSRAEDDAGGQDSDDRTPRHLLEPEDADGSEAYDDEHLADERFEDQHLADDRFADEVREDAEPEDRARLVRPATPLPPAPVEDVPSPQWFATPRQRDEEPPELRALGEERFVPADPAPLPRDVLGWAAWIAVVGAPLFLLVVALGWQDVPQLLTAITAGVFVAGFATLVIRLPSSRDDDDDDGAVV